MNISWIMWIVLIVTSLIVLCINTEDPILKEVKHKYEKLTRDPPPGMEQLRNRTVITGFRERYGEIGYNVNKGHEIGLCLDGTANEVFHVLIHELAHTVTKSYAHNDDFWQNFKKIKEHCIKKGLYKPITDMTDFCGKFIRD